MRLLLAAVVGAALLTLPAAAQTAPEAAEAKKEKKICKRSEGAELGSHLRSRTIKICKTEQEWRDAERVNEQGMDARDKAGTAG